MAKKNAPRPSTKPAFVVGEGDEQYRTPDFTARIVGVDYNVYVPKSAASIALARTIKTDKRGQIKKEDRTEALDAIMKWVKQAFDVEDSEAIETRLQDPKDRLDIEHMTEFMEKVNEYQTRETENPTT